MKLRFSASLLLTAVSLSAQPKSVDEPPSARDLLQRVVETYRNLNSFAWTAIATVTTDSGDFQPHATTFAGEFHRPRQMRMESLNGPPLPMIAVTDGKTAVEYYPSRRGFCRPDLKLLLQPAPHEAALRLGSSLPYEHITNGLKLAHLAANRKLKIGDEVVDCRVVTVIYAPAKSQWTGAVQSVPITYWIDPKTNIVVQQSYQTTLKIPRRSRLRTDTATSTLLRYRLNPKIPNARFTFQPPQGVTEKSCLSFSSGGGVD